ncbi:MAG: endonuclease/exonuclease/phosphatase family protein [Candidatus Binatia bacterium]
MRAMTHFTALAIACASAAAAAPLKVMTYNVLHGQPCSGGSLGSEVAPRMALAVAGGPNGEPGLTSLAPDVIGMQEVSQVLVDQTVAENQACGVIALLPPPIGGVPPGVTAVTAYEHQGDNLVRLLNGAVTGSPYRMRFVRDNPRILPLLPDVPLPPDDKTLSDHSTETGNIEIGLAVVSKLRIQQVTVHNLTIGFVPGETRAILHATLRDDSGKPYDFYDSHLTTTGGDSPQTVLMATEILRFITTTRRHPENPGFFTCDCNAEEGSAVYEIFADAGFIDSFRAIHPSAAGLTSGRDGLDTDCNQQVTARIDYVWAIPDAAGATPPVVSSEVVMDYNELNLALGGCRWPSDHNGVITTFDVD